MQIGLAVNDISAIQKEAGMQRIIYQVLLICFQYLLNNYTGH